MRIIHSTRTTTIWSQARLWLATLLLLPLAAFAQTVWNGTADINWYINSLPLQNEFTITTAEQLAGLVALVNGSESLDVGIHQMEGITIKLGNNIILNDTANWRNWVTTPPANKWTPIGIGSYDIGGTLYFVAFKGTFDGNGHTISGVYLNGNIDNVDDCQGLFGLNEGTIKNLGITASYIKGIDFLGTFAGYNKGTISDSYFIGAVAGEYNLGGLVGYNVGTVSGSYSAGTVTGTVEAIGGLVGDNDGTVSNSYSTVTVTGTGEVVGGLAGLNYGTISDSYSTGTVTGGDNVGGLVGVLDEGGTISGSYSTCAVTGTGTGAWSSAWSVGGLVGYNDGTVSNSYSTGAVTGIENVGGLVGLNDEGTISNSYSIGEVIGEVDFGGLVGFIENSTITNSYYDSQTSGQSDTGKGVGKTTAQMKQQATFVNWDFASVWWISSSTNNGYPYLLWGSEPPKTSQEKCLETPGKEWYNGICRDTLTPVRHPQIASGNIRAYAAGGSIVLENLPSEAKIEVYSLQGKRIYSANSENSQILAILIQTKGVYIAKIGTQSFRVAVK